MSRGTWIAAWAISAIAGAVAGIAGLDKLLRYSPYGDPGALTGGLVLCALATVLICAIPAGCFARFVIEAEVGYRAWKRSLPAEQQLAISAAEAAGLMGAHLWWRDHNRKMDAELTASVMGGDQGSEDH